ncbi:hypothetical protein AGMMS49974_03060 [Deltaproteobacteria bacterium]|nr:hypothetical protein AGMMS49974_03060 [Deltaproteobacteria bacterium]
MRPDKSFPSSEEAVRLENACIIRKQAEQQADKVHFKEPRSFSAS